MSLVYIHLSDIHFGQEKDGGTYAVDADAKERLLDDARSEISRGGGSATGIIVTGDIAYSGKKAEYRDAGTWLARLADAVGCSPASIQLIPGNHDIDRSKITPVTTLMLDAIRDSGDAALDVMLDVEQDRAMLYARFEAYTDFALDYDCELNLHGTFSTGSPVALAENRTIRFVRLNSALICSRRDDEGRLILGKRQRTLPRADGQEIVVLVHHPLNWFQDSDTARRYLLNRARVVISGHEHFPTLAIERTPDDCDIMMLAAGATSPDTIDENFVYKYNILTFDWDEATDGLGVTINPRTWDADALRFRHDSAFMAGRQDRQVLSSPNFKAAPRSGSGPADIAGASDAAGADDDVGETCDQSSNGELAEGADLGPRSRSQAKPKTDSGIPMSERLLQLRFFQKLTTGQRLQALAQLDAVPPGLERNLNHTMERRLFRKLMREGKAAEVERFMAAATEGGADR